MMEKHTCEICGSEGEVDPGKNPNFVCPVCGAEKDLLLRRELVDLDEAGDGGLVLRMAAGSLKEI